MHNVECFCGDIRIAILVLYVTYIIVFPRKCINKNTIIIYNVYYSVHVKIYE